MNHGDFFQRMLKRGFLRDLRALVVIKYLISVHLPQRHKEH